MLFLTVSQKPSGFPSPQTNTWPFFMTEQGFSSGIAYSFARSSLKEVSSTVIFTFFMMYSH